MTIKIQSYQKFGKKTNKIEDEYEFCCWDNLRKWLDNFSNHHKCPECSKEVGSERKPGVYIEKAVNLTKDGFEAIREICRDDSKPSYKTGENKNGKN